jgi:hypothetical protein
VLTPPSICQACGRPFIATRPWQGYCSNTCANRDRQKRRRQAQKCRDSRPAVPSPTKCRDTVQATPLRPSAPILHVKNRSSTVAKPSPAEDLPLKPSPLDSKPVLSGDDVELEYYEDGYPKIPACLDRRAKA